jgi:hypothetical protein
MLRYLLDEHLTYLARPLRERAPTVTVWCVGDSDAPVRGTPDAALLAWCEAHAVVLVTEDASTMPLALAAHLAEGGHVPGIFVITRRIEGWAALDLLVLAAGASVPDEHRDQIRYLRTL